MSLVMGIVGLPNVGKSSLFNLLTGGNALVENRPFATIDPNIGVVKLLDPRLDKLTEIANPEKVTHSLVKFLDIAGLVKGASEGEGLGNKFLENIRSVDAICLVVRVFDDKDVFNVHEKVDPVFDAEIVLCELVYSDLFMVENILKKLKKNDSKIKLLERVRDHLKENKLILNFPFTEEEKNDLRIYSFLTDKQIIILANTDDSEKSKNLLLEVKKYSENLGASFLEMNIKLENDIVSLPEEEKKEFLLSFGRTETCLNQLVSLAFKKLNLSTFFTVGKQEVRSWSFLTGSTAEECAEIIHTDIRRGFIKAKIAKYEDFLEFKDFKILKNVGKLSLEGRKYVMKDGDIVYFEFNV